MVGGVKGHGGMVTPELCGDLLEIRVELKSAFSFLFFKQHSGSHSTAARSVGGRVAPSVGGRVASSGGGKCRPVWGAGRRPVWASFGGMFSGMKHAQSFKTRAVSGCRSRLRLSSALFEQLTVCTPCSWAS